MSSRPVVRCPARTRSATSDDGNAIVEFLAAAVLLLVPVVYLALLLGRIQAATFAAEGAAREAGRTAATASRIQDAVERATVSVDIALDDQGFDDVDPASALTLLCSTEPCLQPGSDIETVVAFDVDLPFVPEFVEGVVPLRVPVVARHVAPVDSFAERP